MGILQNGYRHNLIGKIYGATNIDGWRPQVGVGQGHRANANRNMFAGEAITDDLASVPNGNRPSQAWIMARKNGRMSSHSLANLAVTTVAAGAMGFPIDGTASFIISTNTPDGQLISSGTGSASFTFAATGNVLATLSTTGTASITLTTNTLMGAIKWLDATAGMSITATMTSYGRGYMVGNTVDTSQMTPDTVATAVWNALLSNYQVVGSTGEALGAAGSGGVNYSALAQAVWEYMDRTLTAGGSGATPEDIAAAILAAAQITPIYSDMRKTNGQTLVGDGTESNKFRSSLVP